MAYAQTAYISAAANRHSNAACASHASLVAYGSATYVALWNAEVLVLTLNARETLTPHAGSY